MRNEAARRTADGAVPFDTAHRALLADPTYQFDLSAASPPPPPETSGWLRAIAEWLSWAMQPVVRSLAWLFAHLPDWPYARLLLWTVIVLAATLAAWVVVERVRHGEWRLPRRRRRRRMEPVSEADEPRFEAAPARAWLQEADALAAAGRFAEAAHLLLRRSVEDLARRRPGIVQPALTARELGRLPVWPPPVRERFAGIAELVERSLFGGRPVDGDAWRRARDRYAELVLPGAWR